MVGSFFIFLKGRPMPKEKQPLPPGELLIEQLHGADWTACCDAARQLGQSRDSRAADALRPDLNDSDWRVRQNAAQALKDWTLTVRQRATAGNFFL